MVEENEWKVSSWVLLGLFGSFYWFLILLVVVGWGYLSVY